MKKEFLKAGLSPTGLRQALNRELAMLASCNAGTNPPQQVGVGMLWLDVSNPSEHILKIRLQNSWAELCRIDVVKKQAKSGSVWLKKELDNKLKLDDRKIAWLDDSLKLRQEHLPLSTSYIKFVPSLKDIPRDASQRALYITKNDMAIYIADGIKISRARTGGVESINGQYGKVNITLNDIGLSNLAKYAQRGVPPPQRTKLGFRAQSKASINAVNNKASQEELEALRARLDSFCKLEIDDYRIRQITKQPAYTRKTDLGARLYYIVSQIKGTDYGISPQKKLFSELLYYVPNRLARNRFVVNGGRILLASSPGQAKALNLRGRDKLPSIADEGWKWWVGATKLTAHHPTVYPEPGK